MKNRFVLLVVAVLLMSVNSRFNLLHAQGSLTPPGAPAPSMKSLAQIEPRIPITTLPYTIQTPGSYYVVTNLTGVSGQYGISLFCGGATIDLGGFTLAGVSGSLSGVYVSGAYTNITVQNGNLNGWTYAVDGQTVAAKPRGVICDHLTTSFNTLGGITLDEAGLVRDCLVAGNSGPGISIGSGEILRCVCRKNIQGITVTNGLVSDCLADANTYGIIATTSTVVNCTAQRSLGYGIGSTAGVVRGCSAFNNGTGSEGIYAAQSQIIDCTIRGNYTGMELSECQVKNCEVSYSRMDGIDGQPAAFGKNEIRDCHIFGNGGMGIYHFQSTGVVAGNYIANNSYGLYMTTGVQALGNTFAGNTNGAIDISGSSNIIDNNTVQTPAGIAGIFISSAPYTNNIIIRNTVIGNGANGLSFLGSSANVTGQIITTTSSGAITGSNPFSNISF